MDERLLLHSRKLELYNNVGEREMRKLRIAALFLLRLVFLGFLYVIDTGRTVCEYLQIILEYVVEILLAERRVIGGQPRYNDASLPKEFLKAGCHHGGLAPKRESYEQSSFMDDRGVAIPIYRLSLDIHKKVL